MSDYDNTNRGALFTNKRRQRDSQPAFTGRLNVEGREYWISAWGKTSKAGEKFLSLSVNPVQEVNTGPTSFEELGGFDSASGSEYKDIDDDIPF
jgi:hypothetical protein